MGAVHRIASAVAAVWLIVLLASMGADTVRAEAATETAMAEDTGEPWDPLEPINRVMFGMNEFLILLIATPVVAPYEGTAPDEMKEAVDNFLSNLREPLNLANTLLQGDLDQAWNTLARFVINSTVGVGGLFDQATDMGYAGRKEDLGQTLAVWGVPEMFYMVLPGFGPMYPRDLAGRFGDEYMSPWQYVAPDDFVTATAWAGRANSYANVRSELETVQKTSVDYYAAIRSMYTQKRRGDIRNGAQDDLPAIPDFSDIDDGQAPVAGTPGLVYPLPPTDDGGS